jgi:hypothetical protein
MQFIIYSNLKHYQFIIYYFMYRLIPHLKGLINLKLCDQLFLFFHNNLFIKFIIKIIQIALYLKLFTLIFKIFMVDCDIKKLVSIKKYYNYF